MNKSILHTPQGVRDIYDKDMINRELINNKLISLLRLYGYNGIKTPALEYLSVYYKDITVTRDKDLYKFFDKEGNTLVLRPDFTPSIARAATKYYTNDRIIRLFYEGDVYSNNKRYQGRLVESTQFGAELIGDASIDADAEIIAITVAALKELGLNDFLITIGHSDIIRQLIQLGDFDDNKSLKIRQYISNRNIFDLEKYLYEINCDADLISIFTHACRMYTYDSTDFHSLKEMTKTYDKLSDAVCYLDQLSQILEFYDVLDYISLEPCSDSKFDYYTGIIFQGYANGVGQNVVTGGRYNNLLKNFGTNKAAIGFGIFIDAIQQALDKQNIDIQTSLNKTVIVYNDNARSKAINTAKRLRTEGKIAELISYNDYLKSKELYENENINIMEIN